MGQNMLKKLPVLTTSGPVMNSAILEPNSLVSAGRTSNPSTQTSNFNSLERAH